MPLHPDAIVVVEWPRDPADVTPELARRFCETGDLRALGDAVRECLALDVQPAARLAMGATSHATTIQETDERAPYFA